MKKALSFLLLVAATQLINCGSSSDEPTPTPAGDLTITSITPQTLYADDEITITGTGFDPDKTKNLVQMGASTNPFVPFNKTFDTDPSFVIVSASSTQLVVKALEPQTINYLISYDGEYPIQVTVNGKSALGSVKHTKRLVSFNINTSQVVNKVIGCFDYVQAGDSLHVEGLGFYGNCSMFIDNAKVPGATATADNRIKVRIPKDFFGSLYDDCKEVFATVRIVNGDGKSLEKQYHIATSPPMVISGASFDKIAYSLSNDGNAILTVQGYSFYGSAMLRLSSLNYEQQFPLLGADGYPNEVVMSFSLNGLEAGKSYSVAIKEHFGDEYGFPVASFSVVP